MEKVNSKKTSKKSVDLKTSTINLFLNISNFLLFAVIIFMIYSLYVKFTNAKSVVSYKADGQVASDIIQVEVLNGCYIEGVADRFTEFLRNNGFDVVNIGNYLHHDMDETLIIDRIGNMANAYKVAKALGVKNENVIQQLNNNYFLDVSIIIGKDYFTLKPLK